MKQIILHVGLHKTGSTSIQRTLYKNSSVLSRFNISYPKSIEANHTVPIYTMFCQNPTDYARKHKIQDGLAYNVANRLCLSAEIKKNNPSNLVISGESISSLHKQGLINFKAFLEDCYDENIVFRIIFYVRDIKTFAPSLIQQQMKSTQQYDIQKAINSLYKGRIEKFIDIFGRSSVHVYRFEDAIKAPNSIVGHFLVSCGMDSEGFKQINIEKTANKSLSQVSVDLLFIISNYLNENFDKEKFKYLLDIRGEKFDISSKEKREYEAYLKSDIEWLEKEFNISYTNSESKQTAVYKSTLSNETVADLKNAISQSEPEIKELILNYLSDKCKRLAKTVF